MLVNLKYSLCSVQSQYTAHSGISLIVSYTERVILHGSSAVSDIAIAVFISVVVAAVFVAEVVAVCSCSFRLALK